MAVNPKRQEALPVRPPPTPFEEWGLGGMAYRLVQVRPIQLEGLPGCIPVNSVTWSTGVPYHSNLAQLPLGPHGGGGWATWYMELWGSPPYRKQGKVF